MEHRDAFSHIQIRQMTVYILLLGVHSEVPTHITENFRV
jgi:hypothetical protein